MRKQITRREREWDDIEKGGIQYGREIREKERHIKHREREKEKRGRGRERYRQTEMKRKRRKGQRKCPPPKKKRVDDHFAASTIIEYNALNITRQFKDPQ